MTEKYLHGADRIYDYSSLFAGKRIGLITNPSGMNSQLVSTIELLREKFALCCIFTPEHGLYGAAQAGAEVGNETYRDTGIKVLSMYNHGTEPSAEGLDCLVYDIQDVGLRFYTYIYVMARGMKMAAESGIPFIILDRYNPLGLDVVSGTLLRTEFSSGVGKFELPSRYGLTCGELAGYINNKETIGCELYVVPCKGLKRSDDNRTLGVPFILPSPNLPTYDSLRAYVGAVIFEGTNISEGRGTTKPFETFGAPFIDEVKLIEFLKAQEFEGVLFRPTRFVPTFSKHAGKVCSGAELVITDYKKFDAFRFGLVTSDYIRRTNTEFEYVKYGEKYSVDHILGTDEFRSQDFSVDSFIEKEKTKVLEFKKQTEKYRLY